MTSAIRFDDFNVVVPCQGAMDDDGVAGRH
jgi:hypothetical protein